MQYIHVLGCYSAVKEEWSHTCCSINKPWKYCARWNKSDTKDKYCKISHWRNIWSRQIQRDMKCISGDQGMRKMGTLKSYRVSVWCDEKILEIHNGDYCTT